MAAPYPTGALLMGKRQASTHPKIAAVPLEAAPRRISYRAFFLALMLQLYRGTCVAFAAAEALTILWGLLYGRPIPPRSARAIYDGCMERDGLAQWRQDSEKATGQVPDGTYQVAAAQTLRDVGCPSERDWPYDPEKVGREPFPAGLLSLPWQIEAYSHGYGLSALKTALQSGPAMIAFNCWEGFFFPTRGQIIGPPPGDNTVQAGHAVCCDGYDDDTGAVDVINHWGPTWGDNGYARLSYACIDAIDAEVVALQPRLTLRADEMGDLNKDGRITPADALLALAQVTGTGHLTPLARQALDLTGDGKDDVRDVVLLLRKALA